MSVNQISYRAPKNERLKCEPDKLQSFCWYNKTTSLGIRVTANGAKSYIFQSWIINKAIQITIGDVNSYSISKAQEESRYFKVLTEYGKDSRTEIAETMAKTGVKRVAQVKAIDIWTYEFIKERKSKWGASQQVNKVTRQLSNPYPKVRYFNLAKALVSHLKQVTLQHPERTKTPIMVC